MVLTMGRSYGGVPFPGGGGGGGEIEYKKKVGMLVENFDN